MTATTTQDEPAASSEPGELARPSPDQAHAVKQWLPFAFALVVSAAILVAADTSVLDIARYAAYAVLTVALPGALVYRALRRTPHTLVEDVTLGLATGLALEFGTWALLSWLDLRAFMSAWPVLVVVPFLTVPRLRRHWSVRNYPAAAPLGWSWTLSGTVVFFTAYLYGCFYAWNPILPDREDTRQFVDLAYQLSLAGEAKHNFPLNLPQAAGEPLQYHWFGFVHIAMGSMIGHIDLPVLTMRLMIPAICALTIMLTGVVGWRLSGRPYVGAIAAVLFFVIGEFSFAANIGWPFGTQVTFIIWPSLSMTYSWAPLVALIGVIGDAIRRRGDDDSVVPVIGWGAYVLAVMFALVSSAAKASSLPVLAGAIAIAAVAVLIGTRRIPWALVGMGVIIGAAQVWVTAVIFAFNSYGLRVAPLSTIQGNWAEPAGGREWWKQAVVVGAVWAAFLLNMELRVAGVLPLIWLRRFRLNPVQWLLLSGAVAGPLYFLMFYGLSATYFTRAAFPFGVILSAWGYVMVFDRAKLSQRGKVALGVGAAVFAVTLTLINLRFGIGYPPGKPWSALWPVFVAGAILGSLALAAGVAWRIGGRWWPALRGRGGLVLLTGALLAGAPTLIMDIQKNSVFPNGGGWGSVPVPKSRVDAGRWVRDHSRPTDVLATNQHCVNGEEFRCDNNLGFWLSAYSERSVLIEGWGFAPRMTVATSYDFWDKARFDLNEDSFYSPTPDKIRQMHDRYHVRYLVVERTVRHESPELAKLATRRFDNARVAVYELR